MVKVKRLSNRAINAVLELASPTRIADTDGMKIDAHQHFWNYDANQYQWIGDDKLRRDFLPEDLAKEQAKVTLDGSIAVQARETVEESRWLLNLADHYALITGVVGWVDLRSATVER